MITDAFSTPKPAKVEPLPTRDTAADAVAADAENERQRHAVLTMLSGSGGVSTELTGTRNIT